jgi:hypothetical protein
MRILPIVEGPGDVEAVPVLVRNTLSRNELHEIKVLTPHRRGDIYRVRRNLVSDYRQALTEEAAILWTFDCDDGCAMEVANELRDALSEEQQPFPLRFALFVREFEGLFLAEQAAASQRLEIKEGAIFPEDPEAIRAAKAWLSERMPRGKAYKPTVHQAAITARLNLDVLSATSRSYRHFEKAVLELARLVRQDGR